MYLLRVSSKIAMTNRHLIFRRSFHSFLPKSDRIFSRHQNVQSLPITPRRSFISFGSVVRSVLRIRYLVIGSAVGGGIHANHKYKEWKDGLPDFDWIKDMIPDPEKQKAIKDNLNVIKDTFMAEDGVFDTVTRNANQTIEQFREMLKERQRRQKELLFLAENSSESSVSETNSNWTVPKLQEIKNPFTTSSNSSEVATKDYDRIRKLQDELIDIQHKYQKEIERLEKENKELRKSLLLKTDKSASERLKKVNKTLIDLYSDVLDELNDFDSNYSTQDHLPRVIVVGDQSAGKTSVLEMIAQARIFPRGAGEMMTRSPVKVTLKEGPYHVARFKNHSREFDLSKDSELSDLRREIEVRMKSKVKDGRSVSKDVIALTVEGPGIPRMVLIDLPGVINTVTSEMAAGTRDAIHEITNSYMQNPNAIILCVQDGSVDAERSIVTDLVSQNDPNGKRTIFVMTKIDVAEHNMTNPSRLKKILEGKLFPMKALGYFAVVTGRGGKDDTIQSIRDYEESFFKNSNLCKQGVLNASQCTTQSLSLAVSDCFWKMVKSSVEQQADLYKARKFNLETEWKNTFAKHRELDRDELFEIGKNQILDQIIKLSHLSADHWENLIFKKLNESFKPFIFEEIYLPSAQKTSSGNFNIQVDIRLKNWIDHILPGKTVEIGWQVLSEQLLNILNHNEEHHKNGDRNISENDFNLFKSLKTAVAEEAINRHKWDIKANDVLKLIQMNASEDKIIAERERWRASVKYLEENIIDRIKMSQAKLREFIGPDWVEQWSSWKSRNHDQFINVNIKNELDKIANQNELKPVLDSDDILLVKKNLRCRKIEVADEDINTIWAEVYKSHFLLGLLSKAQSCEKLYAHHLYKLDSDISCDDVVFFYRIHQILQTSSKALRQQITNIEAQRLNREIKDILDDFNQDPEKKSKLLTGKRVNLAEELKRVRQIQEKLEEFIAALNNEK